MIRIYFGVQYSKMKSYQDNIESETLEILIESYLSGNERAAKKIYLKTYSMVGITAVKFFRNPEQSKDAIQNTYVKIFKHLSKLQFKNEASTYAWMKKICTNECISITRKNTSRSRLTEAPIETFVQNKHRLIYHDLIGLIKKLPIQQRKAFHLHAVQGYKHDEIGQILGVGTSNSRTLVCRARKFLRRHCETNGYSFF